MLSRINWKTWWFEAGFVWASLVLALYVFGKADDWREWLAVWGVGFGFHHASVAERLREAQESLNKHTGALDSMPLTRAHHVECVGWLNRYWWLKELGWIAYFTSTGAVSALVGCAVFLAYPSWRKLYRRWRPAWRTR